MYLSVFRIISVPNDLQKQDSESVPIDDNDYDDEKDKNYYNDILIMIIIITTMMMMMITDRDTMPSEMLF